MQEYEIAWEKVNVDTNRNWNFADICSYVFMFGTQTIWHVDTGTSNSNKKLDSDPSIKRR